MYFVTQAIIRRGRPADADALTALALASKAHWGYDEAFMVRAAPELTIRPEHIATAVFFVAEDESGPVGFYGLSGEPPTLALDYLFVVPDRIGTGLGRRLWDHALASVRAAGADALELEAEPNAEAFYRSRGAVRIGERMSSLGRALPLMRMSLGAA